ncbi:hypothetical protein B4N89_02430 [Embleya scabrispora]|uniref:Uncharacterized protein n=1 Tax=Embleya scabrispora TaxID=159449 RepID=A0A1T3NT53_9ACTN|nr:hypothetical protein [Embleya scabrispora]OPC79954.1 hypothetical protein B4N89_02430 [Embleya scabrispora]
MTEITRTFTHDELDELDVPFEHMVEEHVTDTSHRWHTTHEGVFRHPADGRHYRIRWQMPATERQECDLWLTDPVVAVEVEQRPVTAMQWVPVDEAIDAASPVRESRTTWEHIAAAIQARGDELRESGGELSSREIRDAYHDAARMVRAAATPTTHGRSPAEPEQPADTIRRAATHLRALANAAAQGGGEWEFHQDDADLADLFDEDDPARLGTTGTLATVGGGNLLHGPIHRTAGPCIDTRHGRYIATLDPAAGLTLADVLDAQAAGGDALVLAFAHRILGEQP